MPSCGNSRILYDLRAAGLSPIIAWAWPQPLLDFVAGNQLALMLDKDLQNPNGLFLETNSLRTLVQLSSSQVEFEGS
jgi:hypothetical protein